ncbi:MAG: M3 family oligoendopeptidase [Alphaproteobacteria bacterium]|nr:M3 family oligoendopeptidase [Alphaproteobacteria bacterium]
MPLDTRDDLGKLPEWDLSDLYRDPAAPELAVDLATAETEAVAFEADIKGRLSDLDGPALAAAIARYEAIDERLGRIGSYAQLVHASDMSDPEIGRFYQSMVERVNDVSRYLLFFTLELNQITEEALAAPLADPAMERWRSWVTAVRAFRPHQLADEVEQLLHDRGVVGRTSWMRLFDETMADLRVPFRGDSLTSAQILHKLVDADPAVRAEAGPAFGRALGERARVFALITNTLAKEKEIDDRWRKFPRAISSRNLGNQVEDEVVDALVEAVVQAWPSLSHRYYRLKARMFGKETLPWWDRNAPLPQEDSRTIPWDQARDTVLGAYQRFSPDLAAIGQRFFDNAWIDAPVRPGKAPGAFAHPVVPSAHPYLLVNYQGKLRDVMTLAHELGHGCHQVLAGGQGHLLAQTPLTLAETASVFGEMLTFQAVLAAESDPIRRRTLIAGKIEDMLNTVSRQVALHCFEDRVHTARRQGELTPEALGAVWMEVQAAALGPAVTLDADYRMYWAYIPHFIHAPFYVYAYAFGDCLVNSLYAVYQDQPEGFAERYLALLAAGGSQRHATLLAPFGLDARDPAFWSRGLGMIATLIDQLEGLLAA